MKFDKLEDYFKEIEKETPSTKFCYVLTTTYVDINFNFLIKNV